jgi:hypothetical protein
MIRHDGSPGACPRQGRRGARQLPEPRGGTWCHVGLAALAGLRIPVYHAAVHPAVLGRRHVPWETDVTVACAGVTIQPGDILVGDADGVVVLPPAIAAEILADAREQERQEQFIAERVAAGEPIEGLFPLPSARRPEYEAWLAQQAGSDPPSDPQRCDSDAVTTAPMSHRVAKPSSHGPGEAPRTGDAP